MPSHRERAVWTVSCAGSASSPSCDGSTAAPLLPYTTRLTAWGSRGWRTLWQDCLSLLLMTPGVGEMVRLTPAGVRVDDQRHIIGDGLGNFIADRKWHRHPGCGWISPLWPLDDREAVHRPDRGDQYILNAKRPHTSRPPGCPGGRYIDKEWTRIGHRQRRRREGSTTAPFSGASAVQHLAAFYEVGGAQHFPPAGGGLGTTRF